MTPEHLASEIKVYKSRCYQRLAALGYAEHEIQRAARGLLSGTRLGPVGDDDSIHRDWLWVECLSLLLTAESAESHEAAQAAFSKAEKWMDRALVRPAASVGGKVIEGGRTGNEHTHGNATQKQSRWQEYQESLEAKLRQNPSLSLTAARQYVARDYSASLKTITNRTTDPRKK